MDIGTAKPTPAEMAIVPHHLFDIINPDEEFSIAQYQEMAFKVIREVQSRDKIPILVGGSGQYVWSILEGWEIPRVPPDMELRRQLEDLVASRGVDYLYQQLREMDPAAAQRIDKRNVRRVIRALEVIQQAKAPVSVLRGKNPPAFQTLIIGLTAQRKELYQKIDDRVDDMIQKGLLEEVKRLLQSGYDFNLPSMSSIGYKQIGLMLKGEIDQPEAIRQIKTATHRFVRHQYAWFKPEDKRITWFNLDDHAGQEIIILAGYFIDSLTLHG